MRINQPITDREFDFPPGVTLMSTTDTQSHITYANAAFVAVSGYERDELIGQPHNLSCATRTCRLRPLPTCGARSRVANRGPRW
jgi:PAS domain-containing protein